MFNKAYETWTVAGEEYKRRVYSKRTGSIVATFIMDSDEGRALFDHMRQLIRENGGTLFDLDTGEYLK